MRPRSTLLLPVLGALLAATAPGQAIVPEPLRDPRIPAFRFPESEATLTRWVTEQARGATAETRTAAAVALALHGWGLWTALTADTAQFSDGQRLKVFETWVTPDDLLASSDPVARTALARPERLASGHRSTLQPLRQFSRRAAEDDPPDEPAPESAIDRITGFTKFDPTAAAHLATQRLLERATLDQLLAGGAQQVTPFPVTALAVKPIFQIVRARDLVDRRYYALKAWSGPPATPQAYPPSAWPAAVWVDIYEGGRGVGAIEDPFVSDGSARTDATTYPLSAFIHYRLSAADAAALNAAKPGTDAAGGDHAVLVAMHVSGRELARWTWHTFWWTPAPDAPPEPSSPAVAAARPAELRGAARHYAMALAHTMQSPNEPYIGGDNTAPVVYVYNPYVEARFAPADLPDSTPGLDPAGRPATNNHGVQTNCLSCHIQATYNPGKLATAPRFSGARYVDLGAAGFVGTLQTDFLWALPRHAK
ncbi:MAG: hypothetical protein NTV51_19405 [Verrucomicrobia bacterium]|nr:hypothetical protein [Verrucomicrobiota bacterium]